MRHQTPHRPGSWLLMRRAGCVWLGLSSACAQPLFLAEIAVNAQISMRKLARNAEVYDHSGPAGVNGGRQAPPARVVAVPIRVPIPTSRSAQEANVRKIGM